MITYQEYITRDPDGGRAALLYEAVREYKNSKQFRDALCAEAYFRGENERVMRKTILKADRIESRDAAGRRRVRAAMKDVVGNRISSGFFARAVCQENQYLLQNGVTLPAEARLRVGARFDRTLALMGEKALIHGVCYAVWSGGELEMIPAARGRLCGMFGLPDEISGELRAAVHFWQREPGGALMLRVFDPDGTAWWRFDGGKGVRVKLYPWDGEFNGFPVMALYANPERKSELTPALKSKIDAFDCILSDFADNLERTNEVYWVLNNFGGTSEDVAELLAEIERVRAVASISDGSGASATAEPKTIGVPFEARRAALEILKKELYADAMALDPEALTGGSLTNVAIRAAMANLELKTDRYEWQVYDFVYRLLLGLGCRTDEIRFQRQSVANALETARAIALTRNDLDRRTALKLNPLLQPEEVGEILGDLPEDTEENTRGGTAG